LAAQEAEMKESVISVNVGGKHKKAFRIACITANHSINSAILWFVDQVATGGIKLPNKE
jgi:hypothetical protein